MLIQSPLTLKERLGKITKQTDIGVLRENVSWNANPGDHIYPTPPLGQDMTQGQFLSGV